VCFHSPSVTPSAFSPICSTNPFLHILYSSFWTAFMDFVLGAGLLGTHMCIVYITST